MRLATSLPLAALLALAATAAGGDQPTFPYPIHETTLANGLTVMAIPFASPGVVAYFTVVRTGSRDEVEPGHSGFAHFFEHMMFRGTARYSSEAYRDVLKGLGADSNAFTTNDYTCYYLVGPAAELATMADIESDRFKSLRYGEEAFRTEALAVLGEYNKNASNPILPMYERVRDLAYTRHTYKHTTLGFLDDIRAMPGYYEFSLAFFDRFYRPENTTLLVVGDIRPEAVFNLARRYYGDWQRGFRPVEIAAEPPQQESKRASIEWANATRPHLMVGYHMPAFSTATVDTAALDLADQLLTSESAPLYRELVIDRQWVDQFGSFSGYQRDPGLYLVFARVKSKDLVPKVEAAIEAAIAELAARPVADDLLGRIKSHLRYATALELDSPAAIGFRAAEMLSLTGRVAAFDELFARQAKATPADVQRIVREIFRPANRTTVVLSHQKPPDPPAPAEPPEPPQPAATEVGR